MSWEKTCDNCKNFEASKLRTKIDHIIYLIGLIFVICALVGGFIVFTIVYILPIIEYISWWFI